MNHVLKLKYPSQQDKGWETKARRETKARQLYRYANQTHNVTVFHNTRGKGLHTVVPVCNHYILWSQYQEEFGLAYPELVPITVAPCVKRHAGNFLVWTYRHSSIVHNICSHQNQNNLWCSTNTKKLTLLCLNSQWTILLQSMAEIWPRETLVIRGPKHTEYWNVLWVLLDWITFF